MNRFNELISRLPIRHQVALSWYFDHTGQKCSWPEPISTPDGQTFLATKAKGIYKPKWSEYALSIRESLQSSYPDGEPVFRSDGTWSYRYFQENIDQFARDNFYTNRALINCKENKIPIGVFRQITKRPKSKYHILGVALVTNWEDGYYLLEGFSSRGFTR